MDRKADGRRIYTPEFKREQLARLSRGEVTTSELSRELGISRSLLQRWKHLAQLATETAVASNVVVVPASELRAAQARIRELERALGGTTMEVEILEATQHACVVESSAFSGSSPVR